MYRRGNVALVLGQLGLSDAFDCIVTGDDVGRPKPAPDGYLRCLRELGAQAAASLAFEDAPLGIAAARAAGLEVLAINGFDSAPIACAIGLELASMPPTIRAVATPAKTAFCSGIDNRPVVAKDVMVS